MESHKTTLRDFIEGASNPKLLKYMQSYLNISEFLKSDECTEEDVLRIGLVTKTLMYEVQQKRMKKEINIDSPRIKS